MDKEVIMAKKVVKWFQPSDRSTGWNKDDKPATRRRKVLKSRWNNPLKAGRAMQSLANVTTDPTTKRLAKSDAQYFFGLHRKRK